MNVKIPVEGRVASVNIGTVETRNYEGRLVRTGAHKHSVPEARLTRFGFEGDEQADRRNHGGPDKAACAYLVNHYRHWETLWKLRLDPGAFGENLTLDGMSEEELCLGDILQVGRTTVQVTQPRQPCSKLAARHGRPDLIDSIRKNGFSGFYVRVLNEGTVRAGDSATLLHPDPAGVSVSFANRVMSRQLDDRPSLDRLLSVQALSAAWREILSNRSPR